MNYSDLIYYSKSKTKSKNVKEFDNVFSFFIRSEDKKW